MLRSTSGIMDVVVFWSPRIVRCASLRTVCNSSDNPVILSQTAARKSSIPIILSKFLLLIWSSSISFIIPSNLSSILPINVRLSTRIMTLNFSNASVNFFWNSGWYNWRAVTILSHFFLSLRPSTCATTSSSASRRRWHARRASPFIFPFIFSSHALTNSV